MMCVYKPLARSYAIYYFFTTKFRSKAPDNKCDTMMIQCEAFLAAYSISCGTCISTRDPATKSIQNSLFVRRVVPCIQTFLM